MKQFFTKYFSHLTKLEILIGFYIFFLFASETMGFKTIPLFSIGELALTVSVAIFLSPLLFSINDVITEVHGYKKSLAVSRLGFLIIILIALYSIFFTALPPSARFEPFNEAYNTVFSFSIRVSIASLTAFAVSQVTDILIFKKIRSRFKKQGLWLRNNLSNIFALFIDTVIFMTIARYSFDLSFSENFLYLLGLIIPYWLLKCSMSLLITPLTYLGVKWLKKDQVSADKT